MQNEEKQKKYCKVCLKELKSWQITGLCNYCERDLSIEGDDSEYYDFEFTDTDGSN